MSSRKKIVLIYQWDKNNNSVKLFRNEDEIKGFYAGHETLMYDGHSVRTREGQYACIDLFDEVLDFISQSYEENCGYGWHSHHVKVMAGLWAEAERLEINLGDLDF